MNVLGDSSLDGLLELTLLDGFTPDASDEFIVLAADSLIGFFDNVNSGQRLDTTNGLGSFVVNYGIGSAFDEARIVLSDFELSDVQPGDFNADGIVDAADFVSFRDNLGASAGTLPNDIDGGPIGAAQFDRLVDNFGLTAAGPAFVSAAVSVPEPAAIGLLAIAFALQPMRRRVASLSNHRDDT